jgi:hypothetical protein
MYECKLCNYIAGTKTNLNKHFKTKSHINKENTNIYCFICNKQYINSNNYKKHKKYMHIDNDNKKSNIVVNNKIISSETQIIIDHVKEEINKSNEQVKEQVKDEINKSNEQVREEIKEEIQNSKKEVVTVVNKAINKASSLIKYLMENHRSVPPLKKITKNQCIPVLRIDYNCPEEDGDYSLQKLFVRDYSKNMFVSNIAKSILKMINHKESDKQPIYNTDSTRYNYVVKLTTDIWNEDKSGIKFTDYIIKPLLKYIRDLVEEYIEEDLEKVNMYKNSFIQNQIHVQQKEDAYNLDIQLTNDYLIKPLLKELSPHLRFLQIELEEIEKLEELTKIQDELEEMINGNSYSDESEDELEKVYDSDFNDNYIKKIKVRMIKV